MNLNSTNPFPGLRSFDYSEHHLFFGRERNVQDLLRKLEQNHFVAIVGTSGTGKSSLIRAGLLPAVHQGKQGERKAEWLIASMKPGNTSLKNLATALMENDVFGTGKKDEDTVRYKEILNLISNSSLGLVQAIRGLLTGNKKLLLLVDQFEEIFRFTDEHSDKNNSESNSFVQLIIDSVRQRDVPVYVILTLRSDFLGDCVRFEGLPEAINDGHYLVPRLTTEQNKAAITGPVDFAKGKISPRLVQRVVNDLGDNPDQLPVLQHALMRTWDCWTNNSTPGEPMDIRHYEMIGAMSEALSEHADEAFKELSNDKQKKLIENIFKCLAVKTKDNRGVRRPTSVQNLMHITGASFEELIEVLHPFRKSGRTFILPDENVSLKPNTILDISHESLMRGWTRFRIWVDEEMESADIYDRLCTGALLYKKGKAALWRDPELQLALDWKKKNNPNKPWSNQYNDHFEASMDFLRVSELERLNETNRMKKRRMIVQGSVLTFLLIVSILSGWALFQTKKATEKSVIAEQKTTEALNQKQLAEQAKEMALAASRKAMDAKSYAELQAKIASEQKGIANAQKSIAEEEAHKAVTQEREALRQKQLAEENSYEAQMQKQKADSAQTEANRLRLISIGQNIAFKSLQQKDDPQLAALLAYQAYKMVNENKGNINDPQLYSAIYTASQNIDPAFKPVIIRENTTVAAMHVSPGSITTILEDGIIKFYDVHSYKLLNSAKLNGATNGFNTAYISNDGRTGAIGLENNKLLVYDLTNPAQPPSILVGHNGLVRAFVVSADGNMLVSGARDSSVIIWKNNTIDKRIRFDSRIRAVAFNEDETKLFIGTEDGAVSVYNINREEKIPFASNRNTRVQAVRCSDTGNRIVISYSNGMVQVLNRKGQVERTLNENGSVDHISLDEKNDLLVLWTASKFLKIYRLADLSQKPVEINCNSNLQGLAVNNGEFIYGAFADKTIRLYPAKTSWFESILSTKITRSFSIEEIKTYIGSDVSIVP